MHKGVRLAVGAVLLLAVLAAAATWWLFYDNRMPTSGRYELDLAAIRKMATRLPGPGPSRIEVEVLSHTDVPRIGIVAGTNWSKLDMARASYRLVYPGRSIIVDTGNSLALARHFGARSYDAAAWSRLIAAMDGASDIVVTHEHADHSGGLVESPHLGAIIGKARVTREQLAEPAEMLPLRWLALREPLLVLVPGHDAVTIAKLERAGLLVRGFHLTPPVPTGLLR